jgi:hypothetical protein
VLFALAYLLLRCLVRVTAGTSNEQMNTEVEVVVLRHQLMVLKRQVGRPRLRRCDRLFMAAVEQDSPSSTVVVIFGQPADPPSVAPGAGAKEVDLPSNVNRRQTTDQGGDSRADPADGEGESEVGMPQDPGRARQARHQGLGDEDPHPPARERARSCTAANRSHLERVPQVPGPGDLGSGLLHGGDRLALHAVRALHDRGRIPSCADPRRHAEPRLSVGDPAGPQPLRWGTGSKRSAS